MANVTTTALQKVRPYVRSAALPNLLLLLSAYISIVALWGVRQPDAWLNFELTRHARYIHLLERVLDVTPAMAVALLLILRPTATSCLVLTTRVLGYHLDYFRVLAIVLAAEWVYLLPSWLHIFWSHFLQGNLNDLPTGSFEPLRFVTMATIGSLDLDLSSMNSYLLMQVFLMAAYLPARSGGSRSTLFFAISTLLLLGAMTSEFAWALIKPGL